MRIEELYQEMIMDHNRSGHNKGDMADPSAVERGHNPNCGDDLTLLVKLENDRVSDASFVGSGCAISQASMSMMIDLVKGVEIDEVQARIEIFLKMIQSVELTSEEIEKIEDCYVFQNLSKMPARVKCGTLGWHCLKVILERS